jgi:hypothetical protein
MPSEGRSQHHRNLLVQPSSTARESGGKKKLVTSPTAASERQCSYDVDLLKHALTSFQKEGR